MTDIEVNYAGMGALARAVDRQEEFVSSARSLVAEGCGDFGAFWGFMEVFQGTYEEAHGHVLAGLEDARLCAASVAETIRANRDTYRDRDLEASTRLSGIDVTVNMAPTASMGPGGGLQTPGGPPITTEDKNVAGLAGLADDIADQADVDLPGSTPGHMHGLTANPTAPVALAGEFQDTYQAGQDASDASEDIDDYEEFERRYGK